MTKKLLRRNEMSSYVVVDLEMCMVPKGARREAFQSSSELIQIGAVVLDSDYKIKDSFMTYVSPEYGAIDSYICKLTGITMKDVHGAPSAKDALEAFANWLPDDAYLVSWSDNDRTQIEREIRGKGISIPRLDAYMSDECWIDCQEMFADRMDSDRHFRLSEALVLANIDYDEGAHDALVDARNTALLFEKVQSPEEFTLSPYLIRSDTADSYTFNPFKRAHSVGAC